MTEETKDTHFSDCSLHNGPAMEPLNCDCGVDPNMTPEEYGSEFPENAVRPLAEGATQPPPAETPKTAMSILVSLCTALEAADKVTKGHASGELRKALDAVPPGDVNLLMTHIQSMYSACEGMRITQIAFRADTEGKRLVAIIGIQFGTKVIELFAPFDEAGWKNMTKEFVGSLDLLNPQRIIMPGEV